jgi:porin
MSSTLRDRLSALAVLALLATPLGAEDGADPAPASGGGAGLREDLARRGVEMSLVVHGEPSWNLAGGQLRGSVVRLPLQAALDLDAERLLGWRGGRLHAGLQALAGRHASEELVGDLQGFDNVDAERFRQLSELWLEQRLFGDRLRLKLGKADANADFARVEASGGFLNSSAGYSPTIQGFPTYPDPAVGLSLSARAASWLSLAAGVYDGATHEGCHGRTGNRGLATLFGAPDALFYVGEAGVHHARGGRPGRLAIGAWRHTGRFAAFDGAERRGASGLYAVLEQRLWQDPADEGQGLDLFVQVGATDGRYAEIDHHVSLGLSASGVVPGRDQDVAGLMLTSVTLGTGLAPAAASLRETALEAFYGFSLRPWLVVKPDVQYIVNPGVGGARDAVVGTLRVTVAF